MHALPPLTRPSLVLTTPRAALTWWLHALTNHQYGFHRDELAVLDDARALA